MTEIKTVGVKELKNQLSAYLRDVRRGARVLVSDRNRVVAELHEPGARYAVDSPIDPQLAEWIQSGIVIPPAVSKGKLPVSPVRLEEGLGERLLEEDRAEPEER